MGLPVIETNRQRVASHFYYSGWERRMLLLHARASKLLLSLDAGNGTNPIFFFVLSLFVCARMEIKQSGRLPERVNWLDAKKINPEEILKYIKIFLCFPPFFEAHSADSFRK